VSRTAVVIVAVVAAALCAAAIVLLVWRPFDDQPPIQTKALGVWQEATTANPVRMIVSAGEDSGATRYWVTSPGTSDTPFPARLEGDRIVVWGENTEDVIWVLTYDPGADALLVVRPPTGERNILRRVSE
jgi:hypothetical protein